jgi:SAM-dependent methyltransferase
MDDHAARDIVCVDGSRQGDLGRPTVTTPETGRLQFPSVDASTDPARHADYLALVATVIAELRAEALEALDLPPEARLLDAGCGLGEHAIEIASRVLPGGRVVGVDASHMMVERARDSALQAGTPVEFMVGDIRALPFADTSFDASRCERVLQHLTPSDAAAAVAELVRVTRRGGVIQLIDVNHYQTALTATDADLARRLVVEGRGTSRYPDAGLFLRVLLSRAGVRDVVVAARAGRFQNLAVFDTVQQLGQSLAEMVARGNVAPGRAQEFRDDLVARDLAGTFLATMIGYIATGRKA